MHKEDSAYTWRNDLKEEYQTDELKIVNPLDTELPDGTPKREIDNDYDKVYEYRADIVRSDIGTLSMCDGVLVNWEDDVQMAGTPMELMYAYSNEIETVLVYDGDIKSLSPWLHYYSHEITDALDEGMNYLIDHV